jgi:hypothetical protein
LRRAWGLGRETVPEPKPSEPDLSATGPTPASWETDVLFVCLRCSGKLPGGLAEDGRTTLRQWVRDKMTAEGRRKALRVVETSCLGLCPEGRIAVAIGRELAAEPAIIRSVETEGDREAIYRAAIEPA